MCVRPRIYLYMDVMRRWMDSPVYSATMVEPLRFCLLQLNQK